MPDVFVKIRDFGLPSRCEMWVVTKTPTSAEVNILPPTLALRDSNPAAYKAEIAEIAALVADHMKEVHDA